jgi:hypothetical protein
MCMIAGRSPNKDSRDGSDVNFLSAAYLPLTICLRCWQYLSIVQRKHQRRPLPPRQINSVVCCFGWSLHFDREA